MRIKRVKYDGSCVRIEYQVERGDAGEPDEYAVACRDEPRQAFRDALAALADDVVEILELPAAYRPGLTARGVSFSWTEVEAGIVLGATITAHKHLMTAHAPLILNTPHLPEEPYSPTGDDRCCLDPECVGRLRDLIAETEAYLAGSRAQGQLFDGAAAAPPRDAPQPEDAPHGEEEAVELTLKRPGTAPRTVRLTAQSGRRIKRALRLKSLKSRSQSGLRAQKP
jgi:hypothetical protein